MKNADVNLRTVQSIVHISGIRLTLTKTRLLILAERRMLFDPCRVLWRTERLTGKVERLIRTVRIPWAQS
jgi:hypothetical protein